MSKSRKQRPAPASHWLRTPDGQDLYAESRGQGPAIVCCNGICCTDHYWKYLQPYFQQDYRVMTWDYRAHGRTPPPSDVRQMTVEQMAEDLHTVVSELAPQGAVFVGHSMGAQVILEYYAHHPEAVLGLVPVCGTFARPADTFQLPGASIVLPALLSFLRDNHRGVDVAMQRLGNPRLAFEFARTVGLIDAELCRFEDMEPYFLHIKRLKFEPILALFDDLFAHDVSPVLPKIEVPTLIVAGENDIMTPPTMSLEMQRKIRGSELLTIPGGSHAALFEQPELINLRLDKFLRQHVI